MSLRDELLPCPFCGAEARSHTFWNESLFSHDQVEYLQIGCPDDCDIFMSSEQHAELIATWNRRAADRLEARGPSREEDIPGIVERGECGEKLDAVEASAWAGYELGWRDGLNAALTDTGHGGEG